MIGYAGAPRYARAIEALTGDDELVPPGLVLEDDRPEWSYVKRESLWSDRINLGAQGAGNFSYVQYENPILLTKPAGPGMIVVVQGLLPSVIVGVTSVWIFGLTNTQAAAGVGAGGTVITSIGFRDGRSSSDFVRHATVRRRTFFNTAGGFPDGQVDGVVGIVLNVFTTPITFSFILPPGFTFRIANGTANNAMDGVVWGYERQAREAELAEL